MSGGGGGGGPPEPCAARPQLATGDSPAISAAMFSAGLVGNLTALALLLLLLPARRRRRRPFSLFHLLVSALVLTDLLGTCLLSPVVLAAYGRNRTLLALAEGRWLCPYFAFAMSFFGLATVLVLFAMALERCLALARPYLYERLVRRRSALLALAALYAFAAAFCALPLLGFGRHALYCPGTWCFIQMRLGRAAGEAAYSLLYASLLLLLVLAVLLCNLSVGRSLLAMHRRGQPSRRLASSRGRPAGAGAGAGARAAAGRRRLSMSEEMDHLIFLSIMTIAFIVCYLPFTIRAYMNKFVQNERDKDFRDLLALRFLSLNPIIDPWIFVILRPPVLRVIRSALCCQMSLKTQDNIQAPAAAKPKSDKQPDLCGQ